MELLLDDKTGMAVVKDGMPVYVHEDGKQVPFDAVGTTVKLTALDKRIVEKKEKIGELSEKLKTFEGIEDPEAAKKALETVSNLDAKKLVDAGKMDSLKQQLTEIAAQELKQQKEGFTTQLTERDTQIGKLTDTVNYLMISSNFAKSEYFSGENPKTLLPPDMAAEYFGKHFKVEGEGHDVTITGYLDGEKILSRKNPMEPADFEEAISVIIDRYPMKDRIMRSTPGGPGSQHNINVDGNSAVTITRADASNPEIYRAARDKAKEAGVPIKII